LIFAVFPLKAFYWRWIHWL